jgi:hypothetical protein
MTARPHARPIYVIPLRPERGVDAIRALRLVLKYLLRRFGMRGGEA